LIDKRFSLLVQLESLSDRWGSLGRRCRQRLLRCVDGLIELAARGVGRR
jgi:hypothetical protein